MPDLNINSFSNYKLEYEKNGYAIINNVFNNDESNQLKKIQLNMLSHLTIQ